MVTRHGTAEITLPSDREILITRRFEAPPELVWELTTSPWHVLRWWGPDWCPLVSCEIDLRVGGSWRYVARDAEGNELGWHGTYREVDAPGRLVSTEVFEGFPDAESVNTVTLEAGVLDDGRPLTTLRTLVTHATQEFRDGHLQSGMEDGMQLTFNRLEDLLAASHTTAERFRRVAGRFSDRVREVPADRWDSPAPCEGWVARDVIRHLTDWVPAVLASAELDLPESPPVDDDPVGAWSALSDGLQAALDDPDVASRRFDAGPAGPQTVESAIGMLVLGDVLVHTWDLARATGLDETIDQHIAAEMLAGMEPMDDMLRGSGHYGPRVHVDDDADVTAKLIAFTGRTP